MLANIYRVLNEKLHTTEGSLFLYGDSPSSLDAALFAHIARLMEFPAALQNHLQNYPTLVRYYERIMKKYFSAALGEKTTDNAFVVRSAERW